MSSRLSWDRTTPASYATAIIYTLIIVVGNLIVDILYVVVDPQITLG